MNKVKTTFIFLLICLIIIIPLVKNSTDKNSEAITLDNLIDYMKSENVISETGVKFDASMIGAISGVKYSQFEMYEYNINSTSFKNIASTIHVKRDKIIVINGKFILLCYNVNNKNSIIIAFQNFN
jgi:hypothetical protein